MIGIAPTKPAPATAATTNTPIALSVSPFTSCPTPGTIALHTAGKMPLPPPPPPPDRLTNALLMALRVARVRPDARFQGHERATAATEPTGSRRALAAER